MKIVKLVLPFFVIIIADACKKEPLTKPVEFPETTYETLASYDTLGRPSNLLPKDNISNEMLSYIENTLIERSDLRTTSPELLTTKAIADLKITQSSDVFITFVSQVTNYRNTLGFYTYPTNNPPASAKDIRKITYVFPSVSLETPLKAGDKVKIGRFDVGTSIGFVLMRDSWDPVTKTINNKVVHFCSNDILNPEIDPNLKKHAVLINYPSENKMLIGFENTDRTEKKCDHDFNDVVIYATVTP